MKKSSNEEPTVEIGTKPKAEINYPTDKMVCPLGSRNGNDKELDCQKPHWHEARRIDKTAKLGNQKNGVRIENKASENRVGGENDGTDPKDKAKGNIIAYNGIGFANQLKGQGVVIVSKEATGNSIRMNSIFKNYGRGIDLRDDSFTVNDAGGDADVGPNGLQDYPVVRRVDGFTGARNIRWMLDSETTTEYWIDFYSNDEGDKSGFGAGKKYLRSSKITTDKDGRWYSANIAFGAGEQRISATATNVVTLSTSEFSMIDTDGDGLADSWELTGIDYDENGVVDLTLSNAKIDVRDIYVEVDSLLTPAIQFAAGDFTAVETAFSNSGVVTLHVEPDENKLAAGAWGADPWPGFDALKTEHFGTTAEQGKKAARSAKHSALGRVVEPLMRKEALSCMN